MSTSLSSIKYGNINGFNQPKITPSTKRKLESLGIDPTLVTSESQALSLIASRQAEKSFQSFTEQKEINPEPVKQTEQTDNYSAMLLQSNNIRYLLGL